MATAFITHEKFFWYDSLNQAFPPFQIQPGGNPDRPEIKNRVLSLLRASNAMFELIEIHPIPASDAEITRVHTPRYLKSLVEMDRKGLGVDAGPGAVFAHGHFEIARLASGAAITAVNAIMENKAKNAYAFVRPPGHHAETHRGAGFCVLNNGAIAAAHALAQNGINRVAILDWDVHHGNGAQQIFYDNPDVLTMSIHQDYYFMEENTGTVEHIGAGAGKGYNINVPLPPGSGDVTYEAVMNQVIEPALEAFDPDFIIVASGLDAGCYDPLGRMAVTPNGFRNIAANIRILSEKLCDGRLVLTQEGGYDLASTPYMGLAVVEGISGIDFGIENPFQIFGSTLGFTDVVLDHQTKVIHAAANKVKLLRNRLAE